jgi:multicomponent Na+:H+ antiporter subunit D
MTAELTIVLAVLVPLAGAALIAASHRHPNQREAVTLVTAFALFALVLSLLSPILAGERPETTIWQILPGLSIAFEVEPLGIVFALVASFLWIVTSVYAIGYMRAHHEENQTRFYACFAIALSSAIGVAFAANMFTLFIFYEVLTLSTYPLVTHHGTDEARRGGRTYLGLLLFTSIAFQLLAIVWTWSITGTLDFTVGGILTDKVTPVVAGMLLLLYMFGIGKAALMPFHRWLPAAMVAPTPVSALLHAVAVVKAGVFTVVKVSVYIFGIDLLADIEARHLLLFVASFTIIGASLVALRQDNLKRRLAYSTVSQLSYVVLGAMLVTEASIIGSGIHIAMHAFGKITLFFCAGAILVAAHKTNVSELDGLGWTMPVTMLAFLVGALSVIGLPPLGGSWSKFLLAMGAARTEQYIFIAVLMVSTLLNVAYLIPPVIRSFFVLPTVTSEAPTGIKEAPVTCLAAICITATGSVILFFAADSLYALLSPIVTVPG